MSDEIRCWLLVGDTPSGPFTPEQVRAKLAAGEMTGQTRACPVGGVEWLPVSGIPAILPAHVNAAREVQRLPVEKCSAG